jgi:hypothetical protein
MCSYVADLATVGVIFCAQKARNSIIGLSVLKSSGVLKLGLPNTFGYSEQAYWVLSVYNTRESSTKCILWLGVRAWWMLDLPMSGNTHSEYTLSLCCNSYTVSQSSEALHWIRLSDFPLKRLFALLANSAIVSLSLLLPGINFVLHGTAGSRHAEDFWEQTAVENMSV